MNYILFYEVVPDFVNKRAPHRAVHLEMVRAAHERGELLMAGALADPPDGAVLIFAGAGGGAAAERFALSDPYVINGLVPSWRVRKWTTVVGDGSTWPPI